MFWRCFSSSRTPMTSTRGWSTRCVCCRARTWARMRRASSHCSRNTRSVAAVQGRDISAAILNSSLDVVSWLCVHLHTRAIVIVYNTVWYTDDTRQSGVASENSISVQVPNCLLIKLRSMFVRHPVIMYTLCHIIFLLYDLHVDL